MPIRVPKELPAIQELKKEHIFVMDEERATHQDIRPLEILILNLMPKKSETELQLLRLLGNTPLQVNVEFLHTDTHQAKNTPSEHLVRFYHTFEEVKDKFYDGLIVTGAPIEQIPFESVDYWPELIKIFAWSKQHVFSTLHICWGAQAGLYYHHGIQKYLVDKKYSGIYSHDVLEKEWSILQGFDDVFLAPHSRHTDVKAADIQAIPELKILAQSPEVGVFLVGNINQRAFYMMGHLEYARNTLREEFERDTEKGLAPALPENYFPNDDKEGLPQLKWRMSASLLFSNWLNYTVYQNTPFDLRTLANQS